MIGSYTFLAYFTITCSGHGWCDENDRCICFRAPGTANQHLAYTGPDCSGRVCAYGRSHDLVSPELIQIAMECSVLQHIRSHV